MASLGSRGRDTLRSADAVVTSGWWAGRKKAVAAVSLAHSLGELRRAGNISYFEAAVVKDARLLSVPAFVDEAHDSSLFDLHRIFDSDVYKWLEAVAQHDRETLEATVVDAADRIIDLIVDAQMDDGYLNTWIQMHHPERRWVDWEYAFELYCGGHLISAAVAWHRRIGDDRLLKVARAFADHVRTAISASPQPIVAKHPGIEFALADLAEATGVLEYLDLAETLIDRRGAEPPQRWPFTPEFYLEDQRVADASEIRGHAVMALYLLTGAVDVAMAKGDPALLAAAERQWEDLVATKLYVTGGVGARHYEEGFGDPYELPNDRAYAETCAAVASVQLSQRLLRATGNVRYADLVERTLYNAVLPGMSLQGDSFFYDNPLKVRDVANRAPGVARSGRQPWFECACCPPNVMRLIASVEQFVATQSAAGIQIDQFVSAAISGRTPAGGAVALELTTDLPFGTGATAIGIGATDGTEWELAIRIPEWAAVGAVQLHGVTGSPEILSVTDRYLRVTRTWVAGERLTIELAPSVRLVSAHPMVESCRGKVAIERGPLVYCVESVDQPDVGPLDLVAIDIHAPIALAECVIGGEVFPSLELSATSTDPAEWGTSLYAPVTGFPSGPATSFTARAIPYFAWANRGPTAMNVWLPAAHQ